MNQNSSKFHNDQDTWARLASVRLSPYQLAEARIQLAQAEAIVEYFYAAWTAISSVTRRVAAAIVRESAAFADAYAESALKASMRQRDRYLAQATDTADLERRLRSWQAPRFEPRLN